MRTPRSNHARLAVATAAAAGMALAACQPLIPQAGPAAGARAFQDTCATCHGSDGRGAGLMGRDLLKLPPDLTGLSARNGGSFPAQYVVGVLDGSARHPGFSGAMPDFGGSGMGAGVMVDVAGVDRPVPAALAGVLAYLQDIQG